MDRKTYLRILHPSSYQEDLAKAFQVFYTPEPWNDRFTCPKCAQGSDPANWPRFKEKEECPNCKTPTEIFWSVERISLLLDDRTKRPGFIFIGAFEGEKLIGWTWGYQKEPHQFYLDFIGVLKGHRDQTPFQRRLTAILFGLKARINLVKQIPLIDWLCQQTDSVVWLIFLYLAKEAANEGNTQISSRTHVKARNILRLLKFAGFQEERREEKGGRVVCSRTL